MGIVNGKKNYKGIFCPRTFYILFCWNMREYFSVLHLLLRKLAWKTFCHGDTWIFWSIVLLCGDEIILFVESDFFVLKFLK